MLNLSFFFFFNFGKKNLDFHTDFLKLCVNIFVNTDIKKNVEIWYFHGFLYAIYIHISQF